MADVLNPYKGYSPVQNKPGNIITNFALTETSDMAHKLKEVEREMLGEGVNIVNDISDILSDPLLSEKYMSVLNGDIYTEKNEALTEAISKYRGLQEHFENENTVLNQTTKNTVKTLNENGFNPSSPVQGYLATNLPVLQMAWVQNIYKNIIKTVSSDDLTVERQIESAYLIDSDGNEFDIRELTLNKDKARTVYGSLKRPLINTMIAISEFKDGYDLIANTTGASRKNRDAVDLSFRIDRIEVEINPTTHETKTVNVDISPNNVAFGSIHTQVDVEGTDISVIISGKIDFDKAILQIIASPEVKKIGIDGKLSASNNLKSAGVAWRRTAKQITIGVKEGLTTGLTQQAILAQKALYGIDALSKTVSLMKRTLSQFKDMEIGGYLDEHYNTYRTSEYVRTSVFDCEPDANYHLGKVAWIKERLPRTFEKMAVKLRGILKIQNLQFRVLAHPDVMLLLDDINWVVGPMSGVQSMGGIKLDYSLGVRTNMSNYMFMSSDRVDKAEGFRIYVIPTDGAHETFTLYNFATIFTDQYLDPSLPMSKKAVHASEMYEFDKMFPIQGRIVPINDDLEEMDIKDEIYDKFKVSQE